MKDCIDKRLQPAVLAARLGHGMMAVMGGLLVAATLVGWGASPVAAQPESEESDPLGLIEHIDVSRNDTLEGSVVWEVWFCDTPIGDLRMVPDKVLTLLNREVSGYFRWLSDDRYRPEFIYGGMIEDDDLRECDFSTRDVRGKPSLIIDDTSYNGGTANIAGRDALVGGGTVVRAPGTRGPFLSTVTHEIGHVLALPHSFGGLIYWGDGDVYEYDNPMDFMSGGENNDINLGTSAVNRYAAGWIDPDEVRIHDGDTATYELRPHGAGGTQMLILLGPEPGVFFSLGARVAIGYDAAVPREGVEVYRVDQRDGACGRVACWAERRRTQPFPPAERGAGYAEDLTARQIARFVQHVYRVGNTLEVGGATVEVVERQGNNYIVEVVGGVKPDPAEPEPVEAPVSNTFNGRFSDDDGNVHEENIEFIAGLGITLGCHQDEFCPSMPISRAQMMAFIARALGEEGDVEKTTSRFSDVPDNAWYLPYVERLADLGVVEAYEDGTFRPKNPVTRLDMAVFLTRAFDHVHVVVPVGVFADVPAHTVHAGAVEGLLAVGVTKGCSVEPLLYCPDEPVPRDQMASFFARTLAPEQPAAGVKANVAQAEWPSGITSRLL